MHRRPGAPVGLGRRPALWGKKVINRRLADSVSGYGIRRGAGQSYSVERNARGEGFNEVCRSIADADRDPVTWAIVDALTSKTRLPRHTRGITTSRAV